MGLRSWLLDRLDLVSPSKVMLQSTGEIMREVIEAERAAAIRRAALDPALVNMLASAYEMADKLKRCVVGTSEDTREMRYQGRALRRWLDAHTTEDEQRAATDVVCQRSLARWRSAAKEDA